MQDNPKAVSEGFDSFDLHTDVTEELGNVVAVLDGLTIEVEMNGRIQRVRYLGVESENSENATDAAEAATSLNKFLVDGKQVVLVADLTQSDPFGNLLRYVYVDGELVNEAIIINGYARVAERPDSFSMQTRLLLAEESARMARRGIWSDHEFEGSDSGTDFQSASASRSQGTLPALPGSSPQNRICDYSSTQAPVIKGVIEPAGTRVYYVPGHPTYSSVRIQSPRGDHFFCTELEAVLDGWIAAR